MSRQFCDIWRWQSVQNRSEEWQCVQCSPSEQSPGSVRRTGLERATRIELASSAWEAGRRSHGDQSLPSVNRYLTSRWCSTFLTVSRSRADKPRTSQSQRTTPLARSAPAGRGDLAIVANTSRKLPPSVTESGLCRIARKFSPKILPFVTKAAFYAYLAGQPVPPNRPPGVKRQEVGTPDGDCTNC